MQQAMQQFFLQMKSTSSLSASSALMMLELSTVTSEMSQANLPGCCVTYNFDIISKPCCFQYFDGMNATSCTAAKEQGGIAHHHAGANCQSVQHIYAQGNEAGSIV
jgi:hypothetical protein